MTDLHAILAMLTDERAAGRLVVPESLGKSLLSASGIAVPHGVVVDSRDSIEAAVAAVDGPVAVKAVPEGTHHKSEVGAVRGPLTGRAETLDAVAQMWRAFGPPVLLEQWHQAGVECFLSVTTRGRHGPVVSVGLGGTWVEVLRDVAHRSAPVDLDEAREMLDALRAAPLLRGARGRPAVDRPSLAETVSVLSRLVTDAAVTAVVAEVEINPLLAGPLGPPVALDCALTLRPLPPTDAVNGERP